MKCKDFDIALHDLFIGELAPERKGEVLTHASKCQRCSNLLKTAQEISCQDFVAFLNLYLDGQVDQARKAVFDRHLAICPECTAYLESYRKSIELGRESAADDGSDEVKGMPDGLVTAILRSLKDG